MVLNSTKLIDLVQAREPLWNPRNNFYRNRDMKQMLWTEIAHELQVTRETVKTKWSCLRDSFRRELKRRNDDSFLMKTEWPFFSRMFFLTTAMNAKEQLTDHDYLDKPDSRDYYTPTSHQDNGTSVEAPTTSADSRTSANREDISSSSTVRSEGHGAGPSGKMSPSLQKNYQEMTRQKRQLRKLKKRLRKQRDNDEDHHFALSLVSSMRRVPNNMKMIMRLQVMETIRSHFQSELMTDAPTMEDTRRTASVLSASTSLSSDEDSRHFVTEDYKVSTGKFKDV